MLRTSYGPTNVDRLIHTRALLESEFVVETRPFGCHVFLTVRKRRQNPEATRFCCHWPLPDEPNSALRLQSCQRGQPDGKPEIHMREHLLVSVDRALVEGDNED